MPAPAPSRCRWTVASTRFFDLPELLGVELIDAARSDHAAQGCERQAADQVVRLGQAVRERDRIRHAVLHGEPQVDEVCGWRSWAITIPVWVVSQTCLEQGEPSQW
jgi:hypothetical protein